MGLNQYCCITLKLNLLPLYEIPRTPHYLFGHGGKKRKRTPKPLNQRKKTPQLLQYIEIQLNWAECGGYNGDSCHQFQETFWVFNLGIHSFMFICCLIQFHTFVSFRLFTPSSPHFPYLLSFYVFIDLLFLSLQLFSPFLSYLNKILSVLIKFSPQEINECAQLPK